MDDIVERYRKRRAERISVRKDAEFKEEDHPRDKDGKFTSGGGSSGGGGEKSKPREVKLSASVGKDINNKKEAADFFKKMNVGDTVVVQDAFGRENPYVRLEDEDGPRGKQAVFGRLNPETGELMDETNMSVSRGGSTRYEKLSADNMGSIVAEAKRSKNKRAVENGANTQTLRVSGTYSPDEVTSLTSYVVTKGKYPMKKKYGG